MGAKGALFKFRRVSKVKQVRPTCDGEVKGQRDPGLGVDLAEVRARVRGRHVLYSQAPRVRSVRRQYL